MIMHIEHMHMHLQQTSGTGNVYSPDILPLLQSLLADLADIDMAYEKNIEVIRQSQVEEESKSQMRARLRQSHDEQRAPYVQELIALWERIKPRFD